MVLSAGKITGIFGGHYYWYGRRQLLLVRSAVIITGNVGGNYYWYLRAEILFCICSFVRNYEPRLEQHVIKKIFLGGT